MELLYKVVGNVLYVKRSAPFGGEGMVEHGISIPNGITEDFIDDCFRDRRAGVFIQYAFRWMRPEDREFLISGILPSQWDDMFGSSWGREDR